MGKGVSKLHASQLVSLCRERKESLKAAKHYRYDFVTSFVVYLESLLELGNALNQYVEQELIFLDDCDAHVCLSDSHPSQEDSHLKFTSSDSDSDSDIDSCHHFHCECEEEKKPTFLGDFTCKHQSTTNVDVNNNMEGKEKPRIESKTSQESSSMSSMNHHIGHDEQSQKSFGKSQNLNNQNFFGVPMSSSPYYNNIDRYVHYGSKPFPIAISPNNNVESQKQGTEQNNNPVTASSVPPPPQASTWDFLYPFSMNYDVNVPYDYDFDVREVREREGIPDLEDENGQSSTVSVSHQSGMRHGSSNENSNVTQLSASEDALSTKSKEHKGKRKTSEKEMKCKLEPISVEDVETTEQDSESLGTCSVTISVACFTMSLKEAVVDVRNEFKFIFESGKEFSSVIEVGKLPHHSIGTKLKAFASCVLGMITPKVQTCLCPSYMPYQPLPKARVLSIADKPNVQENICSTSSDLSSILDKIYVWEKKLHGEVVVEEKLRISYDMQCKRLKELDSMGSEPDKIDDTLASIKLLHSEISVAVASISVISREIHELRDQKLLPELNKFIEGLEILWKVMRSCHQKQFNAITRAKSHVHMIDYEKKKKSSSKATLKLERVILNWGMCFKNFTNTLKALVKHLNDWLMRQILQQPEETKDGVGPCSTSNLQTPPIFTVCNNWYQEIEKISETEVSNVIRNFASTLHQLNEKLKEEKAQKDRVKCHFKYYQLKLQSFCKKNGIISQQCSSFINMKVSEEFVESEIPLLGEADDNLATSREKLIEQRKRHREVIENVNNFASSCLQEGLTPIFEALGSFCLENLKMYEQLKLPI